MPDKLSVALPIYQMQPIAWLAFEGLANQVDAGDWELIILEEVEGSCGDELLELYKDRLMVAGCRQVKFVRYHEHVRLLQKWIKAAEVMSVNSLGMLLQAGDDYSQKDRLRITRQCFENGYGWVQENKSIFINLDTGKLAMLDVSGGEIFKTGGGMAITADIIRKVKDNGIVKGVDHYLFSYVEAENAKIYSYIPDVLTLSTNGFNHLSKLRGGFIEFNKPPFYGTSLKLEDLVSNEVAERLLDLRNEVAERLLDLRNEVAERLLDLRNEIPLTINFKEMKVRMLTNRGIYRKGEIYKVEEAVGRLFILEQSAEMVEEVKVKEKKQVYETKELKVHRKTKAATAKK